jgi:hypothetical protein
MSVALFSGVSFLVEWRKSKREEVVFGGSEEDGGDETVMQALEVLWETLLSVQLCHWMGL